MATKSNATLWCDYIDNLPLLRERLYNAKYVCRQTYTQNTTAICGRKRKPMHRQRLKAVGERSRIRGEAKSKFFGLVFSDGLISVQDAESVADIVLEESLMHHCVGSYHSKTDSLILSACIDGQRIETINYRSLKQKSFKAGAFATRIPNIPSRIINLVESNIPLIEERLVA